MLKSGKSAKIIATDPVNNQYKILDSNTQMKSVSPEEIEKIDTKKYSDYRVSGPNPENPEELNIKEKDLELDQF
jgi:hypothetical protein